MKIRNLAAIFILAVVCLAQQPGTEWKTATEFPNVDWHGLTGARKAEALSFIRGETCACGCGFMIAECRMKDPGCGVSRKLANAAIQGFIDKKSIVQIREELKKLASTPPPVLEEAVKIPIEGAPSQGSATAKYTIVEFSDFQCPFCMKAVAQAKELLRQNANVRLVYKQFPLEAHRDAQFGSEVALAAQAQGKFWQMHDLLYAGFPDLSRRTVTKYAQQLGMDLKQFNADLDNHKFLARVKAEEKEGEAAGVDGTPTFFINGRKYNGVFEADAVQAALKDVK